MREFHFPRLQSANQIQSTFKIEEAQKQPSSSVLHRWFGRIERIPSSERQINLFDKESYYSSYE